MSDKPSDFNKLPTGGKIIFLIIMGAIAWYIFAPNSESSNTNNLKKVHSKLEAYTMSQGFVKNKLKSPSTAEFTCDYEKNVTQISDSMFVVNGFVDSQNSFGAMLRSSYRCTLLFKPNDMVSCENIEIQ